MKDFMLGTARRTARPLAAEVSNKELFVAVGTTNAGKPFLQVSALVILVN
jgi:hypothetical protein